MPKVCALLHPTYFCDAGVEMGRVLLACTVLMMVCARMLPAVIVVQDFSLKTNSLPLSNK